jgi:hypothetical protein
MQHAGLKTEQARIPVDDGDVRAGAGDGAAEREADATVAAGNDNTLAGEVDSEALGRGGVGHIACGWRRVHGAQGTASTGLSRIGRGAFWVQ